ncbi:hypothetical protein HNQ54_003186 [Anaerocolumna cellulosilytica]|nr:hypothetical protein [Anaerocolumna cellulosilytica]
MAVLWRECQRDIKSYKKLVIYILILVFYIYNCNSAFEISEKITDIMIGYLMVALYSSLGSYSNIAVILALPVDIKAYNSYKTIYFFIKITLVTIITMIILKLKLGSLMVLNLMNLYFIFTVICTLLCINYLSHYLLAICKKKHSYMIFLVIMVLVSGVRLLILNSFHIVLGLNLLVASLLICLLIGALYERINTEKVLHNWF